MNDHLFKAKAATATVKAPEPDPMDPAIVLTYGDLDLVGKMLKKNFQADKDAFMLAISTVTAINVEGVHVLLEPRLLTRLQSRCLDKPNWPKWLAGIVVKQLHDYAGY